MSAGYGGRGGGSFARRGSSSKKVRHRKQDFHEHRVRLAESGTPPDFQTLRARTLQSLDRLGHQVLPPDSSYGMQNWMKSLGILLDDFEARASSMVTLPEGYVAGKEGVLTTLSKGFTFPEMDAPIAGAKDDVARISSGIGNRDAAYFGSRLAALKAKRERLVTELDAERASISRIKAERPGRLFQRILGQRPPSTSETEAHAADLEREIDESDSQTAALHEEELRYREARRELAAAADKLAEIEAKRMERLQLAPEREEATRKLAEEISKILPSQP
jgi:hypothetical protein